MRNKLCLNKLYTSTEPNSNRRNNSFKNKKIDLAGFDSKQQGLADFEIKITLKNDKIKKQ